MKLNKILTAVLHAAIAAAIFSILNEDNKRLNKLESRTEDMDDDIFDLKCAAASLYAGADIKDN